MASEPDAAVSALFQRLIAMPLFAAFATVLPVTELLESNSDSDNPDRESTNRQSVDRIILINPLTQQMMVLGGTAAGFDSVLNDLMRKEGQPPASEASIDSLTVVEVKSEDEIESLGGECVICLEEWRVGDVAKEMLCQHKFHGGCVERWLKIHGSCPVCRYKMPADDFEKKIGGESGRRRREIWVTLSFDDRRSTNEELSSESHELSSESPDL